MQLLCFHMYFLGYNFCKIEAEFGESYVSRTKWKTTRPTGFCDGCGKKILDMEIVP